MLEINSCETELPMCHCPLHIFCYSRDEEFEHFGVFFKAMINLSSESKAVLNTNCNLFQTCQD